MDRHDDFQKQIQDTFNRATDRMHNEMHDSQLQKQQQSFQASLPKR